MVEQANNEEDRLGNLELSKEADELKWFFLYLQDDEHNR